MSVLTYTEAVTRVHKGARHLDVYGPLAWRSRINLDTLNLDDGDNCILGQLYGAYYRGFETLDDLTADFDTYGMGFNVNSTADGPWTNSIKVLNQAWHDYLRVEKGGPVTESDEPYFTLSFLKEAKAEGKTLSDLLDPFTARTVVLTEAQVQKVYDALLNTYSPYDSSFIDLANALGIR
jgi:hypothetical protein